MELYRRIKQRREELNMSQDELAAKLGYKSRSSINKIELGKSDIPQSKIKAFADALDTTPSYLMGWDDEAEQSTEKDELTEEDILTQAAHKVGHEGPLTDDEMDKIKLAIKIALQKNNRQ